jgi:integrase
VAPTNEHSPNDGSRQVLGASSEHFAAAGQAGFNTGGVQAGEAVGVPRGRATAIPGSVRKMPLRKIKDTYYIDLSIQGRRYRECAGTADKREAQEYLERRREELWRQVKLGEKPTVTWIQAVKTWMDHKPRGLPDRYRIKALGIPEDAPLPLTTDTIGEILGRTSASSFNRALNVVGAIHRLSGFTPPSVTRKPNPPGRTRWLRGAEWKRLQKALLKESPLLEQAARFTLATGLRENNVLNLTWDQVDLKRATAFLHADQVKNRQAHGVRLNDEALAVLKERRGVHKRWVFGNPDYPLYKASNKAWYAAVRKAKLKGFRWHDLRHTWASWHVMNGTRIEELQALGGWKSLQMVMRYSHLGTDHLAEAAARVKPID